MFLEQQIEQLTARVERLEAEVSLERAVITIGERGRHDLHCIQEVVAHVWDVPMAGLLRKDRNQRACAARHAGIQIARQLLKYSTPELGQAFGRGHATIQYALREHAQRLLADRDYAAKYFAAHKRISLLLDPQIHADSA